MFSKSVFTAAVAAGLSVLVGATAMAQVSSVQKDDVAPTRPLLENMNPYVGFGFGYMDENDELRTEGMPFNFKFVGSYILRDSWLIDGGLGVLIQNFSNRDSAEAAYSGTIDINPRYRFQGGWQLGPTVRTYIGSGDEFGSYSSVFTSFFGAQGMKEVNLFDEYESRVGASVVTDLTIPNEVAYVSMVELQIAFGSLVKNSPARAASVVTPETSKVAEIQTQPLIIDEAQPIVEQPTPEEKIYFELGETDLSAQAKADLEEWVAQSRANEAGAKDFQVEIVGYSDRSGPEGVNLKVSQDRARAVEKSLLELGVPKEKIRMQWVGERQALQEKSLRDRRVEVKIR
jgi:outer membrane protein OmpA-like peptidoglycan-associated protein